MFAVRRGGHGGINEVLEEVGGEIDDPRTDRLISALVELSSGVIAKE